MPIDIDVQSFAELNNNVTDINNKVTPIQNMVLNDVPAGSNNKISVKRGSVWNIEGEEAYNGQYQEMGNISGEVVLELNATTSRTAVLATITGYTFVTSFGDNMLTSHVYTIFLKQNSTGNYAVRWPYGASVLNMVGPDPNQITAVYVIKLPNGKIFVKCEAFQNTSEIGTVLKEFAPPAITYPNESTAPISFIWSKTPEIAYGGTLSDLYSDWEVASDEFFTVLMFSSYNNLVDLYSIEVILSASGTAYMRTRYGGNIGGTPVIGPWEETVVDISGIPPLWTPQFIETALWLDAADESTLTLDVSSVSEWRDKSGNERHTTSPLSLKPTHTSSGISGMGSIVFSSGVDPMIVPSFASPTGAEGLLVAFVAEKTGEPVNYSSPLTFGAVNAQWSFILPKAGVGAANGENRCWFRNRSVDESHVLSVNNFGVNVPRMVVGTLKDSDGMTLLFDGSVEATRAPAVHVLGSAAALTIGSSPDSSYSGNRFQGRIGEIVAIYGDTSLVTLQKIEGYLAHKWSLAANLPDDHPYKYAPPRKFTNNISWDPSEIETYLWLAANDPDTITLNGSSVSQWSDKSGNNRHAVQATASKQPANGGDFNGLNSLSFGGDDVLETEELFDTSGSIGMMFAVVDHSSGTSRAIMSTRQSGAVNNGWTWRINSSSEVIYFHTGYVPTVNSARNSGKNILGIVRNGLSVAHSVDGSIGSASNISNYAASAYNKTAIGAEDSGAASYFLGLIGEIVVISGTVDAVTRQKIEGYLAHKWGLTENLPEDHPYKLSAPVGRISYETDTITVISGNILEGTTGSTISKVNGDALNLGVPVAGSSGGLFRIYANGSWTFDPNGDFNTLYYPNTISTNVSYHISDGVTEIFSIITVTVLSDVLYVDPLWEDVALLIQAPETGSTIVDVKGKTVTPQGNVVVSTALGYPTIYFDGNGDRLEVGVGGDFNFLHNGSNWTIEFLINPSRMASGDIILDTARGTTTNSGIYIGVDVGKIRVMTFRSVGSSYIIIATLDYVFSANNDYSVTLEYDHSLATGTLKMYVNGVFVASTNKTTNTPSTANSQVMMVGMFSTAAPNSAFQGHFKALRITQGIRYGGDHTPPSWPLPVE